MDIRRVTGFEAVEAAGHLFAAAPERQATERFLADEAHHLLIAYAGDVPAGMVTGVETTHPGTGTEMFLYEIGVADGFRGQGIDRALVSALGRLARERGCRGLWTATGKRPGEAAREEADGMSEWDQAV